MSGRERLARGRAREELPAVERFLVGTLRELCLPVRVCGQIQIPVPPGAGVVIRSQTAGDGGELRPKLPLGVAEARRSRF